MIQNSIITYMSEATEDWPLFFKKSVADAGDASKWLKDKLKTHEPVYGVLERLAPRGKMLEIGCGMAATSIAMSLRGFSCTALDINPSVLGLAEELSKNADSNVVFEQGDMFDLAKFFGKFDIVYSGGVLEHLNKKRAIRLLAEQGKVAKHVVTVIPTKSEEQKAPILRFPYGIKELVRFGKKAGLKPHSILLFKGIEPEYHSLVKHENIDDFIQSLDQISAQRIGVVFESSLGQK